MINNTILNDYEKEALKKFKSLSSKTQKEIDEFIQILIAIREKPDKNPQLKEKENGRSKI